MVIWIVGMSGAGKSTIGQALYKQCKVLHANTVLVDGDQIRALFKHESTDDAYTVEGRRINAERIQSLCVWLDSQGINVICCILSIFQDVSDTNRVLFSAYKEVYIDVPLSRLIQRDNKGLYHAALEGNTQNVVGIDIPYSPPIAADLVIHNSHVEADIAIYTQQIFGLVGDKL